MKPDDLDRILSTDDAIVPASGFRASVMDIVRAEASAPPPIPFPWGRLVFGLVAVLGFVLVLAWTGAVDWMWRQAVLAFDESWPAILAWSAGASVRTSALWVAGALLIALVCWKMSMRLAWPRA